MNRKYQLLDTIENGQSAMSYTLVDKVKTKYPNYFDNIKSPKDYVRWLIRQLVKDDLVTEENGRWYKL